MIDLFESVSVLNRIPPISEEVLKQSLKPLFSWIFVNFIVVKDLDFKVISDMVRYENGNPNYIAGIELMKIFYNEYGLTTPILIFCGNRERALQNIKDNKVREDRVFKVAIEEEEV